MTGTRETKQFSDTTVRIATVMAIPEVLEQLGYDPAALLAEQGFEMSLFENPENLISYSRRSLLLQHCVDRTGCLHFGHLLARRSGLSSLGLVGCFIQRSADVSSALHSLMRYMHLHVRGGVVYLDEQDDMVLFGYRIIQPGIVARGQIEDGAITIIFNVLRELCGPGWKASGVLFPHRKPADTQPLREFFNAPLSFDTAHSGIIFSASWLQRPVVSADQEQCRLLQAQIQQIDNHYNEEFADHVRRVLYPAILTKQATADLIAALFSIHQRTMNRRLNACGTSFQELASQSRFEIAKQFLENSSMQLSDIAETLGYADASAFGRAFRNWSGTTPALWRERYQQSDA